MIIVFRGPYTTCCSKNSMASASAPSPQERASAFFNSLTPVTDTRSYINVCRHPVLLGTNYYTLTHIELMTIRAAAPLRFELNLIFLDAPHNRITYAGTKENIVRQLANLLAYGFCKDCGMKGVRDPHTCQNNVAEKLNAPATDAMCTICQDPCTGVTRMPCGHAFHWVCLSSMYAFEKEAKCPNCRKRARRVQWDTFYEDDTDDED